MFQNEKGLKKSTYTTRFTHSSAATWSLGDMKIKSSFNLQRIHMRSESKVLF